MASGNSSDKATRGKDANLPPSGDATDAAVAAYLNNRDLEQLQALADAEWQEALLRLGYVTLTEDDPAIASERLGR